MHKASRRRDSRASAAADTLLVSQPAVAEQIRKLERLLDAESADLEPIRRQLADRAQTHGVRLRPRVEVEPMDLALRLVARGVGDTTSRARDPCAPSRMSSTAC